MDTHIDRVQALLSISHSAVDRLHPAVDGLHPAVDGLHPAVDGLHPAVDGLHPAVDGHQSTALSEPSNCHLICPDYEPCWEPLDLCEQCWVPCRTHKRI